MNASTASSSSGVNGVMPPEPSLTGTRSTSYGASTAGVIGDRTRTLVGARGREATWAQAGESIEPKPWIELVFSCYCKLTNEQQEALDIKMQGVQVAGTSDNYSYSDVQIVLRD